MSTGRGNKRGKFNRQYFEEIGRKGGRARTAAKRESARFAATIRWARARELKRNTSGL